MSELIQSIKLMKLEDQVVSVELAKKLKELGVKQESLFYFLGNDLGISCNIYVKEDVGFYASIGCGCCASFINDSEVDTYSAFTVAELGEMLPTIISGERTADLQITKGKKGFYVEYWYSSDEVMKSISAEKEADARALMLIYLLENKLVDVAEVNKQLID